MTLIDRFMQKCTVYRQLYRRTSWLPIRSVYIAETGKLYKSGRENDRAMLHVG